MGACTAVIIGGGPAGLTAAYELANRSNIAPLVLEASDMLGGIARTESYRGNRIDIGGHRFFSKSDRVMQWWLELLPLEQTDGDMALLHYQGQQHALGLGAGGPNPDQVDEVMLLRHRRSRIYYLRKFFDYPLTVNGRTLANLGWSRTARAGLSYLWAQAFPRRPERTLEDFLINRFGRSLYDMFFASYTQKVWGVHCRQISADWGAQRIKGLSIARLLKHALVRANWFGGVPQRTTETSLIERFLYPKFGPGQLWELCGKRIEAMGGRIALGHTVERICWRAGHVVSVTARDSQGTAREFAADYVLSTMSVKELIASMEPQAPANVREVAAGLPYRDFLTVGLLVSKMVTRDGEATPSRHVQDNWIYVQEPGVALGRVQIFNNWSPYMVARPDTVWLGLEYFCCEGDALWSQSDDELKRLGVRELAEIGLIDAADVLDGVVIRTKKAYPAYWGTHPRFDEIRSFVDGIENLFLLGRNGMHRYNNQDHSILTAMTAVDNIVDGRLSKTNIWEVNTEMEYHEHLDDERAASAKESP